MQTSRMHQRTIFAIFAVILLSATTASYGQQTAHRIKHVLVVTVTMGFRHDSIPTAEHTIQQLGDTTGLWTTDFVRTPADMQRMMTDQALTKYDAIVFANTTGMLPLPDPIGLLAYIRDGHGFVAMHAGSDTFHQWPGQTSGVSRYARMLGGEFRIHHNQCAVKLQYADPGFPAVAPLIRAAEHSTSANLQSVESGGTSIATPRGWHIFDEIYLFKNFDPTRVHLLLYSMVHPNDGSPKAGLPGLYPISWCRKYGKGRVFYTALGHRKRTWNDPLYQQHILGGIKWALGLARGNARPGNAKPILINISKDSVNK